MSEYGFIKCEYSNVIGNTVVNSEHPLLGAENHLCEATWSFSKMTFSIQINLLCAHILKGHFNCVARVA